jgi:Flp pilus assembly protein TadG
MAGTGRAVGGSARFAREEHGQMFAMAAVLFTLILLVGGLSADYGTTYLAHSKFRNAADAAALAGANERQRNPAGGEAAVRAVALEYLALHGYVPDPPTTTIDVILVPPVPGGAAETVRVVTTRSQPTFFLRLIGISAVNFAATTEAQNGGGFLDVVLSLDITGSMAGQMPQMVEAVKAFLDKINPSTNNPNGPQIAINVFNGKLTPPSGLSLTPSKRVAQTAIYLTSDYPKLAKVIDDSGSASCPAAWPSPQPRSSDTSWLVSRRICPLKSDSGSGTYVGNGFEMAFIDNGSGAFAWNIWDPTLGGRAGGKKVLVVFTDGTNNVTGVPIPTADAATVAAANSVKAGPDGSIGTSDDVEIYTIGFFDTGQGGDASNFATSPPLCPAARIPLNPAPNDSELIAASTSTPGSCDHYFPMNKTDFRSLPTLFTTVAGQILRSRLSR